MLSLFCPSYVLDGSFEAGVLADIQVNWLLGVAGEMSISNGRLAGKSLKCTTTRVSVGWANADANQSRIAIQPSTSYTYQAWYRQTAGAKQTHMKVVYYQADGTTTSAVRVTDFVIGGTDGEKAWTLANNTFVSPSDAAWASVELMYGYWDGVTGTNAQIWFDDVQVGADQSSKVRARSLTCKLNTLDVTLTDPLVVPANGVGISISDPFWTGVVVSAESADPVERVGHEFLTIAATNQVQAFVSAAPFNVSDTPVLARAFSSPGFEAANNSDWVLGGVGSGLATIDATTPHTGTNALKLTNPSAGNYGTSFLRQGIRVAGLSTLTASAWIKGAAALAGPQVRITFANPGAFINKQGIAAFQPSAQAGTSASDYVPTVTTAYARYSHTWVVPPGYVWAFLEIYLNGTGTNTPVFVDDLTVDVDGDGMTLGLANVDFESGTGSWNTYHDTLTTDTAGAHDGTKELVCTNNDTNGAFGAFQTSPQLPPPPGAVARMSFWFRSTHRARAYISFGGVAGFPFGDDFAGAWITGDLAAWTKASVEAVVPSGASTVTAYIMFENEDLLNNGKLGFADSVIFEVAPRNYTGLKVKTSTNTDGTEPVRGSFTTRYPGLWPAMTFELSSINQGFSGQSFTVTNVSVSWPVSKNQPMYAVDFGDPIVTLNDWVRATATDEVLPITSTKISDGAISTPKLAANAVTADKIAAGSVTADKLEAVLVLATKLIGGVLGAARAEMDGNGLRAYTAAGDVVVNIPTDGVTPVKVNAELVAQSLIASGNAVFQGTANEYALGSSTQLDASQSDPTQSPSLASGWDSVTLPVDATYDKDATHYSRSCIFYDSAGDSGGATKTFWTVTQKGDGSHEYALEIKASDRTVLRSIDLGPGGVGPGATAYLNPLGIARMGSYVYLLTADKSSGAGGNANLGQTGGVSGDYAIGFSGGPNEWGMGTYTMPEHGTLKSITVDCGAEAGTVATRAILWNAAGTILAQGSDKTLGVGHSPQTWTMTNLDLPAGTAYFIGIFQANSASKRVGVKSTGSLKYRGNQASPSAFTGTTNWGAPDAGDMQAYLTYTKVTAVTSYVVRRYVQSTLALDATYSAVSFPVATPVTPQLTTDGTNLYIVDRSTTTVWNKYDAVMAKQGSTIDTTVNPASAVFAASAGNADFGAFRMLVSSGGAPGTIGSYDSTGAAQANETFRAAVPVYGLTYGDALGDGARFWSIPQLANALVQTMTKHSTWTWTTASSVYWLGYTWYDSNASGGTHETKVSPRASVTMVRRQQLTITAPAIPGQGGVDDPNNIRFYMLPNASDPGSGGLKLQATQAAVTYLATSYASGGAADPGSNNFPSGGSAVLKSQVAAAGWSLKGDGSTSSFSQKLDEKSGTSDASCTLNVPAGRTYRCLRIIFTGRSANAAGQNFLMQLNADGGANYDYSGINDSNATLTQYTGLAQTTAVVGILEPTGGATGSISAVVIEILNADSTTQRKAYHSRSRNQYTDAVADFRQNIGSGEWRNTSAAVSSILLKSAASNLVDWKATLYGDP